MHDSLHQFVGKNPTSRSLILQHTRLHLDRPKAPPVACRFHMGRLCCAILSAWAATLFAQAATAGKNDLRLLNLCESRHSPIPAGSECGWVKRDADGLVTSAAPSAEAEAQFRSLVSELGAVLAPRLVAPADGLGF